MFPRDVYTAISFAVWDIGKRVVKALVTLPQPFLIIVDKFDRFRVL